jgi:MFS family permease
LTWLIYIRMAAYGWFLFAFTALQPLLRSEQGTSGTVAGLHGTFFAFGVIIAGVTNAAVAHRFGAMRGSTYALTVFSLGVALISLAQPVQWTLIASFLCGIGGSTALNLMQPILLRHHQGKAGDQAFAEANGMGGVFGAVSVGLIGYLAAQQLPWRLVLLMTIGWLVLARMLFGGGSGEVHTPDPAGREQGSLGRTYWIRWGGIVAMIGADFAIGFWAAALIAERTGSELGSSTSLALVFAGGMGIGRIYGGRLVHHFTVDRLLLFAIGATIGAFMIFWLSTVVWLSLVGLFFVGLSLAMLYPLGAVRAVDAATEKPALAFGRIGLGAGVAIASAPLLLGALSDQFGVIRAYLIIPALLIVAAAIVIISPMRTAQPLDA